MSAEHPTSLTGGTDESTAIENVDVRALEDPERAVGVYRSLSRECERLKAATVETLERVLETADTDEVTLPVTPQHIPLLEFGGNEFLDTVSEDLSPQAEALLEMCIETKTQAEQMEMKRSVLAKRLETEFDGVTVERSGSPATPSGENTATSREETTQKQAKGGGSPMFQ